MASNILPYELASGAASGIGGAMLAPGALGTPNPAAAQTPNPAPMPSPSSSPATIAGSSDDIAARISQLTSRDSAWMRSARTDGMKMANRRGLVNSSIGIGAAQGEAIKAAAPVASQESQQRMQRDVSTAQLATQERANLLDNFTAQMGNYQQSLSNTLANDKIPATARSSVQGSLRDQLNYGLSWMQQLYGVRVPGS